MGLSSHLRRVVRIDRPARRQEGLALSHSPSTRTRRPWRRGLFFSDFPFCTRHSGVKDCAVPPIFRRRLWASSENRLPRLPPPAAAFRDP